MLEKEIFLFRECNMSLSVAKTAESLKFILRINSTCSQESFFGDFTFLKDNGIVSEFFETQDELI